MRGFVLPPRVRLSRAAVRAVWAASLLLLLIGTAVPAATTVSAGRSSLAPDLAGPCLGSAAPATATGALGLVGTSTPLPPIVGVSVHVDYFYTELTKIGNQTTEGCVPTSASGTTGAGGSVSVALPIPPNRCGPTLCLVYSGPFGPLGYATSGAPAGYFERDPTNGTSPGTIAWEALLDRSQINVTGTDVVSVDAPVALSASGWDAQGNPAPGPLTYSWNLAGLGWQISSENGPNVTVEGTDGGWTGSLVATVSATYGTTTESAQSAVLFLAPVTTEAASGTATPTPVDPGVPVTFSVTGSGAAGYAYSVTVDPGLGAGSVDGQCSSTRLPNGTANLTCVVRATYPGAGTAFPTASVSNGYSTGHLTLGPVSVHPVEQVSVNAPTFVTYPDRTLNLTVNVTHGTGNAPYGPVCLSVNGGGLTCQFQNGTAWVFPEAFPASGSYGVHAWVADRFGENVTAAAVVVVVPALTARTNGSSTITLFTNQTTALSVVVAGGALPITTWWNLSRPSGTLCWGNLASDGTISCPYPSSFPGVTNLTVTLRDALGSETVVVFRITVTAAPGGSSAPAGTGVSGWVLVGVLAALAGGVLLVALDVRRRSRTRTSTTEGPGVEETELERIARGREHLLARADPVVPRRPDELVADWTGPPVAPEEWAEWISALVADGSLVPSRGADRGLVYRRAPPRPTAPTIQFDPTVWEARRVPLEEASDRSPEPKER